MSSLINGSMPAKALMPLVICENIEFRNTASKSCDDAFALVCACGDTFVRASAS